MIIQEGKSYIYIGNASRHSGKIFECNLIAPNFSGRMTSWFDMGGQSKSFTRDGRGNTFGKVCWEEAKKKPKFKISYWK